MYQMIAHLDPGTKMPELRHPQEQIVHILSGRMKVIVEGAVHELAAGDSFYLATRRRKGVRLGRNLGKCRT